MNGIMKTAQPISALSAMLPWTAEMPEALVRFIGGAELLSGLGLILPSLFRVKPVLTAWAGIGLSTIMLLALVYHVSKGEYPMIGMNLILASIAAFIAWGRFKKAPIKAKK